MSQIFSRFPVLPIVLISLFVWIGLVGLRWGGFFQQAELAAYDKIVVFHTSQEDVTPPITLLTISDKDIEALGRWPISDEQLADLLNTLTRHHARVVGVDIYRDLEVPPGRVKLNDILVNHPEIIMVMKFGEQGHDGIPGPSILSGGDQVGFSDMVVDPGGIVRRGLLFLDDGESFFLSFPLLLALRYLEKVNIGLEPAKENPDFMKLGETVFRPFEANDGGYVNVDADGYQFLLNLNRGKWTFPTITLTNIMAGKVSSHLIENKIVLVGVVAQGVKDHFYTSHCGHVGPCPQVAGIELHGLVVEQLLRASRDKNSSIRVISDTAEEVWIGIWVILAGVLGRKIRGAWQFSGIMFMGGILLLALTGGGMVYGWWIPLVPPMAGWLMNAMIVTAYVSNKEKKERALLMALFSRHVSAEIANEVWDKRDQFWEAGRLKPQRLTMTSLFSDLEGFTTVSEHLSPPRLLDWLNSFMDAMVKIIMEHGGVVDDYHGDMIKADFGVPTARRSDEEIQQDAQNAVRCALAMEKEMERLNQRWEKEGLPPVRMRIGINSGPAIAGSLGSEQRLKFTTIGDSINVAARLESFQKDSEEWSSGKVCRILIGETTKRYIRNIWNTQKVGKVVLKGKKEEVLVYRVVGQ